MEARARIPAARVAGIVAVALAGAVLGAVATSCHSGPTSYIVVEPSRAAAGTLPSGHDAGSDTVVRTRFRNVRFHMWPGVVLSIDTLSGNMHSTRADHVVSFDDKTSFVLAIDTGRIELGVDDLSHLMNTYVFAYRGAPLKGLSFATEGDHLIQRGTLHKVVDIPFEMKAEVSATPAGEIRVHPISMRICTIPGQGLMEALGITLAKLLDLRQAKGVRVVGNDLLLDPTKLLPAPAISGHLVVASVAPGRLVQTFGTTSDRAAAPPLAPDTAAANYMFFRGGTLQFGKLFMVHAEMQIVDLAPGDPFDFDIGQYHEQLVAGYHRTLPNGGLLVFMPDLAKLSAREALTPTPAPGPSEDHSVPRDQPKRETPLHPPTHDTLPRTPDRA